MFSVNIVNILSLNVKIQGLGRYWQLSIRICLSRDGAQLSAKCNYAKFFAFFHPHKPIREGNANCHLQRMLPNWARFSYLFLGRGGGLFFYWGSIVWVFLTFSEDAR